MQMISLISEIWLFTQESLAAHIQLDCWLHTQLRIWNILEYSMTRENIELHKQSALSPTVELFQ